MKDLIWWFPDRSFVSGPEVTRQNRKSLGRTGRHSAGQEVTRPDRKSTIPDRRSASLLHQTWLRFDATDLHWRHSVVPPPQLSTKALRNWKIFVIITNRINYKNKIKVKNNFFFCIRESKLVQFIAISKVWRKLLKILVLNNLFIKS